MFKPNPAMLETEVCTVGFSALAQAFITVWPVPHLKINRKRGRAHTAVSLKCLSAYFPPASALFLALIYTFNFPVVSASCEVPKRARLLHLHPVNRESELFSGATNLQINKITREFLRHANNCWNLLYHTLWRRLVSVSIFLWLGFSHSRLSGCFF